MPVHTPRSREACTQGWASPAPLCEKIQGWVWANTGKGAAGRRLDVQESGLGPAVRRAPAIGERCGCVQPQSASDVAHASVPQHDAEWESGRDRVGRAFTWPFGDEIV
jgi:hypothetical protein